MWYEVIRDIAAGGELLVAPKVPLQLRDVINGFGPQDQYNSDKDTGEQKVNGLLGCVVFFFTYFAAITVAL